MAKKLFISICIFLAITLRCVADDAVNNNASSSVSNNGEAVGSLEDFERQVRAVAKRTAAEAKANKEKAKQEKAKQGIVKQEVVKQEAVKQESIKQESVKQETQSPTKNNITPSGDQSFQVFRYQRNGTVTFSDRVPYQTPYKVITYTSCYACSIKSNIDWYNTKLHLNEFTDTIVQAASLYNVDAAFIRAVIHAESAFNPLARSSKGAMGLMQLMPGTAKDMGVTNTSDPQQNIHGGVKYLASLLQTFNGNFTLAAAAYNAGPSAVAKYSGIPPYEETKTYVKRVNILLARYRSRMDVATN